MKLDRVTITGLDETVCPDNLAELSHEFPFVEWAILFSTNRQGSWPRYPGRRWIEWLLKLKDQWPGMRLAAHLCGSYVESMVRTGTNPMQYAWPNVWERVERVQLNLAGRRFDPRVRFTSALRAWPKQYIYQLGGESDVHFARLAAADLGAATLVPLVDASGGTGRRPDRWVHPAGPYVGYAGGIAPENVETTIQELLRQPEPTPTRFWIDMETGVRSLENQKLADLARVRKVLELTKPWAAPEPFKPKTVAEVIHEYQQGGQA